MRIDWSEFKRIAADHISAGGGSIYRGQRDATWQLTTSIHRTPFVISPDDVTAYANVVLPMVHGGVEAWSGQTWDLASPSGMLQFVAFLQHNGFPTPLLDWSLSPYIAAYFAFESVDAFAPQSEYVAIFAFNERAWLNFYRQVHDFSHPDPHISIVRPRLVGNPKMGLQQGLFTFSNVVDIEAHIRANEALRSLSFLTKYELPVSERWSVMRELSLMGISAVQLMPSVESVCKKAYEDLVHLYAPQAQEAMRGQVAPPVTGSVAEKVEESLPDGDAPQATNPTSGPT